MQRLTMEIACLVEPGLVVEIPRVDDQSVAFPMTPRVSHPGIQKTVGIGMLSFHVDDPESMIELIGKRNRLQRLCDLKRIGHVSGTRYSRHITVRFGQVSRRAIGEVFVLLCE